jgi:hypothetical protein
MLWFNVAPQSVERSHNPASAKSGSVFRLGHFAAIVMATGAADVVRPLALATIGAFHMGDRGQPVV